MSRRISRITQRGTEDDRTETTMKFEDTHPGDKGQTLIEKIRGEMDKAYDKWMEMPGVDTSFGLSKGDISDLESIAIHQGRVEGMCTALAILTNTKEDLQWDSAEARYDDRKRR